LILICICCVLTSIPLGIVIVCFLSFMHAYCICCISHITILKYLRSPDTQMLTQEEMGTDNEEVSRKSLFAFVRCVNVFLSGVLISFHLNRLPIFFLKFFILLIISIIIISLMTLQLASCHYAWCLLCIFNFISNRN